MRDTLDFSASACFVCGASALLCDCVCAACALCVITLVSCVEQERGRAHATPHTMAAVCACVLLAFCLVRIFLYEVDIF